MIRTIHHNLIHILGALLLLVAGTLLLPSEAHAQANVRIIGGASDAERQIVGLNSQILSNIRLLVAKEYNLDPQASSQTAQRALARYNEMRRWLASGDSGNPFFVDNLELYQAGIRTNTMNNVFNELGESNICSTFRDELIADMRQRYREENLTSVRDRASCSVEEILGEGEDLNQLLEGDLGDNGIEAIYQMGLNTENTPLGSFYANYGRATAEGDEAVANELTRLDHGDGHKSIYQAGQNVMVCTQGVPGQGDVQGIRDRCQVATPSEAVRLRVAAMNNIEVAMITSGDELQENAIYQAIDSAVAQVAYNGLTGTAQVSIAPPGSLPGGGTPGGGTPGGGITIPPITIPPADGDPFPQIPDDPDDDAARNLIAIVVRALNEANASSSNPVEDAITRTLTALQYELQTVEAIDRTEQRHDQVSDQYAPHNCYSLRFPQDLINDRTLTLQEMPRTMLGLKKLLVLFIAHEEHFAGDPTVAEIVTELEQLTQTQVLVPTELNIASIATIASSLTQLVNTDPGIPDELELASIIDRFNTSLNIAIGQFNAERDRQIAACELIINPPDDENDLNDPSSDAGP